MDTMSVFGNQGRKPAHSTAGCLPPISGSSARKYKSILLHFTRSTSPVRFSNTMAYKDDYVRRPEDEEEGVLGSASEDALDESEDEEAAFGGGMEEEEEKWE